MKQQIEALPSLTKHPEQLEKLRADDPRTWEAVTNPRNRFFNVRVLPDGTVIANIRLLFTTALCVGVNAHGWVSRYCYEDPLLAMLAADTLQAEEDKPLAGYIATRGNAK